MTFRVEYVGGFLDGMSSEWDMKTEMHDAWGACSVHFMTRGGQIGKGIQTISDHALEQMRNGVHPSELAKQGYRMDHIYRVVSRDVQGDKTIVRLEYQTKK